MLLPHEPLRKDEKEEDDEDEKEEAEEEEGAKPSSKLHLIWDGTKIDDIDDDAMEEVCVGNDYNIRSRDAPQSKDSPSTSKSESLEKIKDMRRNSLLNPPQTWI